MFRPAFTLLLLALNLIAGGTILWLARTDRLRVERETQLMRLLPPDAEELTRIEWSGPALVDTVILERGTDGIWRLPAPDAWPVSPTFMDLMAGLLENPRPRAVLPALADPNSAAELEDYGLDTPEVLLKVTFGNRSDSIRLSGLARPDQPAFAQLESDGRIRVLDPQLLNLLTLSRDQLRDPTLLGINPSEARAISIQFSGGQGLKVRLTRSAADWRFDAPLQARASRARVAEYLEWINNLRPTRFAEATESADGTAPEVRLTLEGNGRQQTLLLHRDLPSGGILARLEERPTYFVVPTAVREDLNRTLDRLRDRDLLPIDPKQVTAVQVSMPERPPVLLQRTESGTWQVSTRTDGETPTSRPADSARINRLVESLAGARITEFVNDAPSTGDLELYQLSRPQREVAVTTPAGVVNLQIGRPDDSRTGLFVRNGSEPYVYKTGFELLAELPVTALAYRDRTLRSPVAAAGAVRITVETLGSASAARSIVPDAEGAESPARSLAAALAPLRATAILAEPFVDLTGGDGRPLPWTYRLLVEPSSGGSGYELFLRRGADGAWVAGSQAVGVLFEPETALTAAVEQLLAAPGAP